MEMKRLLNEQMSNVNAEQKGEVELFTGESYTCSSIAKKRTEAFFTKYKLLPVPYTRPYASSKHVLSVLKVL